MISTLKIIGIIAVVIVFAVFFLSIPEPVEEKKVEKASEIIGVTPEVIYEGAEQQTIIDSAINDITDPPDYVIDDVEFRIDTDNDLEISENQLRLVRILTYNDGTEKRNTVNNLQLEASVLDFITDADTLKPLDQGKLTLRLVLDVEKPIISGEGEFFVFFDEPFEQITLSTSTFDASDVNTNNRIVVDQWTYQISDLLKDRPDGLNTLQVRVDRFVVENEDRTKSYVNPDIIYTIDFDKSSAQTITLGDNGEYIKTYDFDSPISITSKEARSSESLCLSKCRGGGCCSTYSKTTVIPAPTLYNVKITDITTNDVVASDTLRGQCTTYETDSRVDKNRSLSTCLASTGSDSLVFNGQRTQKYRVTIDSPSADFTVNIPETGGKFNYYCYEERTLRFLYTDRYGTSIYTVDKNIRCNFPIN